MAIELQTSQFNIIYVIERDAIKGALKIGKTSFQAYDATKYPPNSYELIEATKNRLKDLATYAVTDYKILHTEIGWFIDSKGMQRRFDDIAVHDVLINSHYTRRIISSGNIDAKEWFEVDLDTAKKAIAAVKEEKETIDGPKIIQKPKKEIVFRKEQKEAIACTSNHFRSGEKKMLWNAKMRFGKTLCALELIRVMQFKKVLILTHRPTVKESWFDDYHNIKFEGYSYGSRDGIKYPMQDKNDKLGYSFEELIKKDRYLYFASMQDLRGSKNISDKGIDKNDGVFKTKWDLIILDEAHEGTETPLGKNVIKGLTNNNSPFLLYLSGTPHKILYHFKENEIYTWDYIMEQQAKANWEKEHPNERNPYEGLATMRYHLYDLGEVYENYTRTEDDYFNFSEFFRVWTGDEGKDGLEMPNDVDTGDFMHADDVRGFLDLLSDDPNHNYPFSTEELCEALSHTLWMVPGVKQAKALEKMIMEHPLHTEKGYFVINVAGEGNSIADLEEQDPDDVKKIEKITKDALQKVFIGIRGDEKTKAQPHNRTITISCGRLNTGVSVPEWTGVLMLSGGYKAGSANYLQTIFRCQTPYKNSGAIKANCYAFDFAPDRTLTVINDSLESQPGSINKKEEKGKAITQRIEDQMRFSPIIAVKGSEVVHYDALTFVRQVNDAYADYIVKKGFKGSRLVKDYSTFTEEDYALLGQLGKLFGGKNVNTTSNGEIELTNSGLKGEKGNKGTKKGGSKTPKSNKWKCPNCNEINEGGSICHKCGSEKPLTKKQKQERREKAQSVLDQIFVRLPLLLFGAVDDASSLTIDELIDDKVIDNSSWHEFMPPKFEKPMLKQIEHLIRMDRLVASASRTVADAKAADLLSIEDRVIAIAQMLHRFHYPDKETVLTPWRVVNMHMSDTLGGYDFYDEQHKSLLLEPRLVRQKITDEVLGNSSTKILEINSKSGVYPLYLAYSLFRLRCDKEKDLTEKKKNQIWKEVLDRNLFVLCKTAMAKKITHRVLAGYKNITTHCEAYPKLINILKNKEKEDKKYNKLLKDLLSDNFWKTYKQFDKNMKFNAIVGNPPYQMEIKGRSEQPPIYHEFYDLAFALSDKVSIISPARFLFKNGKTPEKWNDKMLMDIHFKVVKYFDKANDVFNNVDIKGGVVITYRDTSENFGAINFFIPEKYSLLKEILNKIDREFNLSSIVYSSTSYKYSTLFKENFKSLSKRLSGGSKNYIHSRAPYVLNEVFYKTKPNDNHVYASILSKDKIRESFYFREDYLNTPDNYNYYKVIVPSSNGSGEFGEKLTNPVVLGPKCGSTETFISLGCFEKKVEAENLLKYIKTKFARLLLSSRKATQGNKTSYIWGNIPLQDFSETSDIKWNEDIKKIDEQLYKKYKLSTDEIAFIEQLVRPMD